MKGKLRSVASKISKGKGNEGGARRTMVDVTPASGRKWWRGLECQDLEETSKGPVLQKLPLINHLVNREDGEPTKRAMYRKRPR